MSAGFGHSDVLTNIMGTRCQKLQAQNASEKMIRRAEINVAYYYRTEISSTKMQKFFDDCFHLVASQG